MDREQGFSVIELTVIMTIFAFFAINILITFDDTKNFSKFSETNRKMERIQTLLEKFVETNGYYPCPADGSVSITDEDIGLGTISYPGAMVERRLERGGSNCRRQNPQSDFGALKGYNFNALMLPIPEPPFSLPPGYNVQYARDLNYYTKVAIGAVPIRELGLPTDYMVDAFGNRFTYVVRKELTSRSTFPLSGNSLPTMDVSTFQFAKDTIPFNAGGNVGLEIATEESGLSWIKNAAYILMSHGANGYGAFPFERGVDGGLSVRIPPPDIEQGGTFSIGELENHHMDCEVSDGSADGCPTAIDVEGPYVFNKKFFIPLQPEIAGTAAAVIYDDILFWGVQNSHDLDATPDAQGVYPLIDAYRGYEGDLGLYQEGKAPDQIVGLSLWLDAMDCETIGIDTTGDFQSDRDACGATTGNVVQWYEKGSIFNNFYRFESTDEEPGNRIASHAMAVRALVSSSGSSNYLLPVYDASSSGSSNTVNDRPSILFTNDSSSGASVSSVMALREGLFGPGGVQEEQPGIRPDGFTIFLVAQQNPTPNNLMNTFISRSDFDTENSLSSIAPTTGYTIAQIGDGDYTGNNYIAMGVNDYHDESSSGSAPNAGNFVRVQTDIVGDPTTNVYAFEFNNGTEFLWAYDGCDFRDAKPFGTAQGGPVVHHTSSPYTFLIGDANVGSTTFSEYALEGAIGEIIMYKRTLSSYEREQVTFYLMNKWGAGDPGCTPVSSPDPNGTATQQCKNPASPKKLLGESAADGSECCSGRFDGTNCCALPFQAHNETDPIPRFQEKCTKNSDCCNEAACNAYGFCYNPLETGYKYDTGMGVEYLVSSSTSGSSGSSGSSGGSGSSGSSGSSTGSSSGSSTGSSGLTTTSGSSGLTTTSGSSGVTATSGSSGIIGTSASSGFSTSGSGGIRPDDTGVRPDKRTGPTGPSSLGDSVGGGGGG